MINEVVLVPSRYQSRPAFYPRSGPAWSKQDNLSLAQPLNIFIGYLQNPFHRNCWYPYLNQICRALKDPPETPQIYIPMRALEKLQRQMICILFSKKHFSFWGHRSPEDLPVKVMEPWSCWENNITTALCGIHVSKHFSRCHSIIGREASLAIAGTHAACVHEQRKG